MRDASFIDKQCSGYLPASRLKSCAAPPRKSSGFTLVEVSLVVLITTLLIAHKFNEMVAEFEADIGRAQGQQLNILNEGAYDYAISNFVDIVANNPVAGVATTREPTVAELKALGHLRDNFRETAYFGSNYGILFDKYPAACVADCTIAGLAYLTSPAIINGKLSGSVLGEAVNSIGADGGFSRSAGGDIFGKAGGWNVPNPAPGAPAGILAARNGAGTYLDFTQYLNRDGNLPMTGDLNLGGNEISGLQVAAVGGVCATPGALSTDASGLVVSCQSGTWQQQGSAYWKDPVADAASLPVCDISSQWQTRVVQTPAVGTGPRAHVCNGATWVALSVDNAGNLTVPSVLTLAQAQFSSVVTEGAACPEAGRVAINASGTPMWCNGTWQRQVNVSGDTMTGSLSTRHSSWALIARNAANADNAQPQNASASAYLNDVYIRSAGKWVSQIAAGTTTYNGGALRAIVTRPPASGMVIATCPGGTAVRSGICTGAPPTSYGVYGNGYQCSVSGFSFVSTTVFCG